MNFDEVEIGNRESITVGELRSRILRGKVSQQQQGFDLVFSDAVSGLGTFFFPFFFFFFSESCFDLYL